MAAERAGLALPGFASPGASTEAPIEMLAACHGRIAAQCDTLRRLAAHLRVHGADEAAGQAATAVMRYFDIAAPQHHEDEERDLFPALIESMAGSDATCLHNMTRRLAEEHCALEEAWRALRPLLDAVARGRAPGADGLARIEWFAAASLAHVTQEDAELLPMATRLIGDEALDRIGAAMRERRGIAPVD